MSGGLAGLLTLALAVVTVLLAVRPSPEARSRERLRAGPEAGPPRTPRGRAGPWIASAVVVGLVVMAIGISFGANAGFAINPARDLGPRILAIFAGWGDTALPGNYGNVDGYLWVPIVGPLIGGVLGALLYDVLIRTPLKARGVEPDPEMVEAGADAIEEKDR